MTQQTQLNSHFVNVLTTEKNEAGYAKATTVGAFYLKGSQKLNAQQELTSVNTNSFFVNMEKLTELSNSGVVVKSDFLNLQIDENRNFQGSKEIKSPAATAKLQSAPSANTNNTLASDFIVVRLNTKNEAGYPNTAIIGKMVKKGTTLPTGKQAWTNLVDLNMKKLNELKSTNQLVAGKYLNFSLVPNKNHTGNASVNTSSPVASKTYNDIPF